jgi:hypothetical protein
MVIAEANFLLHPMSDFSPVVATAAHLRSSMPLVCPLLLTNHSYFDLNLAQPWTEKPKAMGQIDLY